MLTKAERLACVELFVHLEAILENLSKSVASDEPHWEVTAKLCEDACVLLDRFPAHAVDNDNIPAAERVTTKLRQLLMEIEVEIFNLQATGYELVELWRPYVRRLLPFLKNLIALGAAPHADEMVTCRHRPEEPRRDVSYPQPTTLLELVQQLETVLINVMVRLEEALAGEVDCERLGRDCDRLFALTTPPLTRRLAPVIDVPPLWLAEIGTDALSAKWGLGIDVENEARAAPRDRLLLLAHRLRDKLAVLQRFSWMPSSELSTPIAANAAEGTRSVDSTSKGNASLKPSARTSKKTWLPNALLLRKEKPEISDRALAAVCGVSHSTISRDRTLKKLKQSQVRSMPSGTLYDGRLEAADER